MERERREREMRERERERERESWKSVLAARLDDNDDVSCMLVSLKISDKFF